MGIADTLVKQGASVYAASRVIHTTGQGHGLTRFVGSDKIQRLTSESESGIISTLNNMLLHSSLPNSHF